MPAYADVKAAWNSAAARLGVTRIGFGAFEIPRPQ
jgi:hypothetical protein